MTREEREQAIRCLKIWIEREPYIQTYKICLEALEQEPIDCANAEHDADGCLGYSTDRGGYLYCQTCLECPKASINNRDLEQEPAYCDRNICLRNAYNGIDCDECEVTKSQEPCEDAISREDVINLKWQGEASEEFLEGYASAIEDARVLPPVKPQEPIEVEASKLQKEYNKGFEDCRRAVISVLKSLNDLQGENVFSKNGLYPWNVIEALPSVNPQPIMRDATPEEQEAIDRYIKSISKPTGVNIFDFYEDEEQEQIDFVQPKKKIPCTIKVQANGEHTACDTCIYKVNDNQTMADECYGCNENPYILIKSWGKKCANCKHHTDVDEIHGYTPCGNCGIEQSNYEPKDKTQLDGEYINKQQIMSDYADWYGYDYQNNWFYKHLKNMPSAIIQHELDEDCISRKAVLSILADHFDNPFDMVRKLPSVIIPNTTIQKSEQNNKKQEEQYEKIDCEKTDCKNCINHNDCDYEQLPSITISQEHDGCKDCKYKDYPEYYYPCCDCKQNYIDKWERAKHWIHRNDDSNDWLECPNCGYGSEGEVKFGEGTPFCPYCGERLEE